MENFKRFTTPIDAPDEEQINLDLKKVEIIDMEINTKDYPEFVDSFVIKANYMDEPMTDAQLDWLNEQDDYIYQLCLARWC